jgi:hypothetical protein
MPATEPAYRPPTEQIAYAAGYLHDDPETPCGRVAAFLRKLALLEIEDLPRGTGISFSTPSDADFEVAARRLEEPRGTSPEAHAMRTRLAAWLRK